MEIRRLEYAQPSGRFGDDEAAISGKINARRVVKAIEVIEIVPRDTPIGNLTANGNIRLQMCDPLSIDLIKDRDAIVGAIRHVHVSLVNSAVEWISQRAFGVARLATAENEGNAPLVGRDREPLEGGLRRVVEIYANDAMMIRIDDKEAVGRG